MKELHCARLFDESYQVLGASDALAELYIQVCRHLRPIGDVTEHLVHLCFDVVSGKLTEV